MFSAACPEAFPKSIVNVTVAEFSAPVPPFVTRRVDAYCAWQTVLDLFAEKGWKCRYSEEEVVRPVPQAEAVLSRPGDAECPALRVWPTADVLAIFRFRAGKEIDFDVDLRELQGPKRLDVFCGFLRAIGRRLGRPVLMDPEGSYDRPVLGFDVEANRVIVLEDPQLR
ncbi:hypothetical protein ACWD3J_47945 [Streptomyces sp. NPDC002755]|uniref:hypothetical protein n=1 Tax=Streptomyces sp. NPDC002884 TaxID=3154544 RepID=UPI003316BA5F